MEEKQLKYEKVRNLQWSDGRLQTWYLTINDKTVDYKEEYVEISEQRRSQLRLVEERRTKANNIIHRWF